MAYGNSGPLRNDLDFSPTHVNKVGTPMNKPLIIYHGPSCNDGIGAATAAYYLYGKDGADYVPMNYGKERDEFCMAGPKYHEHMKLIAGRNVYILDFSFCYTALLSIAASAKEVTMLDHHKTAQDELGVALFSFDDAFKGGDSWSYDHNNLHIQFDMNRSGAKQAWQHFQGGWVPHFAELLDAYDLWKWEDGDDADAFNMGVQAMPRDLDRWIDLVNADNTREIIDRGKPVVSFIVEKMKEIEKHRAERCFHPALDNTIACVNAPYFLASRLGNRLAKTHESGCACVYSIMNDGKVLLSFRSINGKAEQYAKFFGGGGHENAAGASVSFGHLHEIIANYTKEQQKLLHSEVR